MPTNTYLDIEEMLGRKEPVTKEEWIKILECATDMLRPIFKNTTLPRLCDIRLGNPSSFTEREAFFPNQSEAVKKIRSDTACEREAMTEGVFFLTKRFNPRRLGSCESPILGLTRNGQWVLGKAEWEELLPLRSPIPQSQITRKVKSFWVAESSPSTFDDWAEIEIPEVVDILRVVLGSIISRKRMQLADLEEVEKHILGISLTARSIPKENPVS